MDKLKKNKFFEIDGIKIGPKYKPVVIAEIGINHAGSLDVAKQMVDSAERAGIKIVKHQTHIASEEMSQAAKKIVPVHTDKNIFEIIDDCSLSEEEEYELLNYVKNKGMVFMSTPFSRAAADRLNKWNIPAYKIDNYYKKEFENGLAFNDSALGINWRLNQSQLKISIKDRSYRSLKALKE